MHSEGILGMRLYLRYHEMLHTVILYIYRPNSDSRGLTLISYHLTK